MTNICFIGAGNMARSIIGGLVSEGFKGSTITACDPKPATLEALADDFGIRTSTDNAAAVAGADIVVLAVKPQVMKAACEPLRQAIAADCLVVSIAAGISCESLQQWLGAERRIVRCMPNTPSLVRMGASGLYASSTVTDEQRQLAESVMRAVGAVQWLSDEAQIDAVTAVSGSGPAYFFLILEAMVDAGVEQGLDAEVAKALAIQTAAGAAELARTSDVDLAELRKRVTSPGGTTEQAILSFENQQLRAIIKQAMQACADRSREMAAQLGQ